MQLPRISVIIPYYNAKSFIEGAIASIMRQHYTPLEIILVDDGSTDDIASRVAQWGDSVLFLQQENKGPASARNLGLAHAKGEFIAFLDADDLWSDHKLALQLPVLLNNPDCGLVSGAMAFVNAGDAPLTAAGHPLHVHLGAALIRRSVFKTVGTFDESLRFNEDLDWFMRAKEQSIVMQSVDETVLICQRHRANMTNGVTIKDSQLLNVLKKSINRRNQEAPEPHSPLVSVILPVYNGEAFLRETIESVLSQDHDPIELIAVDDGSTDGSCDILASYAGSVTLIRQPNAGVAAARNAGLAAARGEYIAFIDQDDLWAPDKTSTQLCHMLANPELDYVLSRQRFFLQPGTVCPPWFKPEMLKSDHKGYVLGAMLAHRRVFETTGPLDSSFAYADDVAWFFEAKDRGIAMSHLPGIALHKRLHGSNASRNVAVIHRELLRLARESIARQSHG